MKRVVSVALTLVGLAFMGVAIVALDYAFGPCAPHCTAFAENAKMAKGYGAVAAAFGLLAWSFVGLLNVDMVRRPPPYRIEDRP